MTAFKMFDSGAADKFSNEDEVVYRIPKLQPGRKQRSKRKKRQVPPILFPGPPRYGRTTSNGTDSSNENDSFDPIDIDPFDPDDYEVIDNGTWKNPGIGEGGGKGGKSGGGRGGSGGGGG